VTIRVATRGLWSRVRSRPLTWCSPILLAPVVTTATARVPLQTLAGWAALCWAAAHLKALAQAVTADGIHVWRYHPMTGRWPRFILVGTLAHTLLLTGLARIPWREAAGTGFGLIPAVLGLLTATALSVDATHTWGRAGLTALTHQARTTAQRVRRTLRR
jgi:hypothetical protein